MSNTPKNVAILSSDISPVTIEIIENELMNYLRTNHPELARKAPDYFRQYRMTETLIEGNFFCEAPSSWKKEWVFVFDGGDCYFQFSYDQTQKKISAFNVNGNA